MHYITFYTYLYISMHINVYAVSLQIESFKEKSSKLLHTEERLICGEKFI